MCVDPVTMAVVSGITTAAGTAYGAVQQAGAYNRQAAMFSRQAALEREAGSYQAERQGEGIRQQIAAGVASASGAGLRLTGTTGAGIRDIGREGAMDVAAARFGTEVNQQNLGMQAKNARSNARSALIGGALNTASSLINVYSDYKDMTAPTDMDAGSVTRPTVLGQGAAFARTRYRPTFNYGSV